MTIGVDRVQVYKTESTALGGKDSDQGPYGGPEPIKPQQDAIESAGGYVQDESNRDETVGWYRSNGELFLFDNQQPATALKNLGGDDDQVKVVIESVDTFSVEEDHQHQVFDELVVDGDYVIDGEGVLFGGDEAQVFDGYLSSGLYFFTDSWFDVPLNSESVKTDGYNHSTSQNNSVITVYRGGNYLVSYTVGMGTIGEETTGESRLVKNSGSGYVEVGGTKANTCHGTMWYCDATACVTRIIPLAARDKLKVQVRRQTGDSTMELNPNACGLTLRRL